MTLLERFFVATFKAIDVFFSTLSPAPRVVVERRIRYGALGESYEEPYEDDGIDQEKTVDRP